MAIALDHPHVHESVERVGRGCGFCGQLSGSSAADDSWRALHQDDLFVAVPSVGSFVPGWLLVVPREHFVNLASMGPELVARMWEFVGSFSQQWEKEFGQVIAFEHGPAFEGRPAGCGVDHAHLHLVPCGDIDLVQSARTLLSMFDWMPSRGLASLASGTIDGMDYLYIRDRTREVAASQHDIPSQALRKVLATEMGFPAEFNWREHPRLDTLRETIRRAAGAAGA